MSRIGLHDIAITDVVWCMAYKRRFRGGGVYCAMGVQSYCNRVGFAGGRGSLSCTYSWNGVSLRRQAGVLRQ